MKPDLLVQLTQWKVSPARKPLLLRGPRQVGKSWLVQEFSKQFERYVIINFEKEKRALGCENCRAGF